jgi:DNA-binding transcriptional MerR regulator
MRIGEVAAQCEVNVQTIRFYERRGLLKKPGRLPSGYRYYFSDVVDTVRFIKQAQELGFSLAEIHQLLKLREGTVVDTPAVQMLVETRLHKLDEKISQMRRMREELSTLITACNCLDGRSSCRILDRSQIARAAAEGTASSESAVPGSQLRSRRSKKRRRV